MKLMITGHRIEKLHNYDTDCIKVLLSELVEQAKNNGCSFGLSGMASGVDLWFCQACIENSIPYAAYIPFEEQADYMTKEDAIKREKYIKAAKLIKKVRNNHMVEECDQAIVVWDGNKGGTHNCFQQLLEMKKNIWWLVLTKMKIVEI